MFELKLILKIIGKFNKKYKQKNHHILELKICCSQSKTFKMKSNKGLFVQNIKQACKFFDLYGQNVNLFIDKKSKLYTTFSGIISIAVLGLIIYTFTGFITSWLNKEKMTLIPSSISYSSIELLTINQNHEYEFNFQNYYIYWVITAILPDGTALGTQDLKSYFSYNVTYTSEYNIIEELPTEPCKISQQDIFLALDEAKIQSDNGKTAPNRICIKNDIKMGLFPDATVNSIRRPGFYFSVYPCTNSTANNNSFIYIHTTEYTVQFKMR